MVIPAAEGSDQLLLANNPEWRYVTGFHGLQWKPSDQLSMQIITSGCMSALQHQRKTPNIE